MEDLKPESGDFIYIKNLQDNSVVFYDEITSIGVKSYLTSTGLCFDFNGEAVGRTVSIYGKCKAYVCNEESKKFYSRLFFKNISSKLG